ncbi:radical SAM protein [Phosphitispora sp. TUW77]|uniref:radical SAM protein n=1 Tax=Phosphitispora sp. TUW77 TaxID=3152361 RepID=UPI003AB6B280
MKKILRGLHFQSVSGMDYYYDDCSGMVFPCPGGLKNTLLNQDADSLDRLEKTPPEQLEYWERFIQERHHKYGAFWAPGSFPQIPSKPDPDVLAETTARNGFRQLILTVTGTCNLQCRYCINSMIYPYSETMPSETMSLQVAKKAVDYYLDNIARIRRSDPCRTAVITFYGGEPLLQFPLIEEVVRYIREKKVANVLFTISTNGLLLDDKVTDFFVANNFAVWVSLDGPEQQHDRNRTTPGGKGSFSDVFANIKRFWQRHSDYPLLGFLVTYDWRSDISELWQFFKSHQEFKKSLFMFNPVGSHFTDYYKQFSQQERNAFFESVATIRKNLYAPLTDDDNDPLINFFILSPYRLHLMRKILGLPGRPEIPGTGTCLPGEKICVLPDGRLQPCERVPGLANIGTVETGLNYKVIAELINMYNRNITTQCSGCRIMQLCKTCFSHFWSGKDFCKPTPSFCENQVQWTGELLSEIYSLLEEVPGYYEEVMKIYQRRYSQMLSLNF